MSTQFDASLGHFEPISDDVLAAHSREIATTMKMPGKLANAKLHAENELNRLINACNRVAWGGQPSDLRAPSPAEMSEVLARLSAEDRDKLMRDAKLACEQRNLVTQLALAETTFLETQHLEQEALARLEAERADFEAFEAHDAAGKQDRFTAWRASRG